MKRLVRKYPTKEELIERINAYFRTHRYEVLDDLFERVGVGSFGELYQAERRGKFGLDCGFTRFVPANIDMYKEWQRAYGKYDAMIYESEVQFPYDCQSVSLKGQQAMKCVFDLGLEELLMADSVLD